MSSIFYVIAMKTKTDKTIYLCSDIGEAMKWEFSKENAFWFETEKELKDFAKRYFKNFNNWFIETVEWCL